MPSEVRSPFFVLNQDDPQWAILKQRSLRQRLGLPPTVSQDKIPDGLAVSELTRWEWNGPVMSQKGAEAFLDAIRLNESLATEDNLLRGTRYESMDIRNQYLEGYVWGHGIRVAILSILMGEKTGADLDVLAAAALFHDFGKVLRKLHELAKKPGKLSNPEFRVMKTHPSHGMAMLAAILKKLKKGGESAERFIGKKRQILEAILYHHERRDGEGYYKKPPDQVPLEAAIITVADAVDAAGPGRHYQPGISAEGVYEELRRCAKMDYRPAVLQALGRPTTKFDPTRPEHQFNPDLVTACTASWADDGGKIAAPYHLRERAIDFSSVEAAAA